MGLVMLRINKADQEAIREKVREGRIEGGGFFAVKQLRPACAVKPLRRFSELPE
jgi:hypothetical protein